MIEGCEIRILSVDSHRLFREGIAAVIKNQPDMLLVAEAASGAEALQRFREHQPDITLMDTRLPDANGIEAMLAILAHFPKARVILVSTYEGGVELQSTLQSGAWGHILKTMHPREIVETIRGVYAGKKYAPLPATSRAAGHSGSRALTSREVEVLAHAAGGKRNHDIGRRLSISEDKVKNHWKQIMQKLGTCNQSNALNIAARRGFIRL
jgi:DNA-binding NarL/FixJ family response regulator